MSRDISKDIRRTGNRVSRNITIAMRAERVIARRRLAVMRTQTGLMAFAGLIAGIGMVMLSLALFFWLAASYGNATAGLIVAVLDFILALVLMSIAGRMSVEAELEPVTEVRDLALEDIEAEVGDAMTELRDVADGVKRMARDPFGTAGQNLAGPLLSILLKALKK